ncbi:MAG: ATP-dependent endonuclease [Planctomycetota bacterium]
MRISRILIEGFKGLRTFRLDTVPNLLVLVGPNGVGKTSVLEAIGMLKDWIGSYSNSQSRGQGLVNAASDTALIQVDFELSAPERQWLSERSVKVASSNLRGEMRIQNGVQPAVNADDALKALFKNYGLSEGLGVFEHFGAHRRMRSEDVRSMSVEFTPRSREGVNVAHGRSTFREVFRDFANLVLQDYITFSQTHEARDSTKPLRDLFDRLFYPKRLSGPHATQRDGIHFVVETPDGQHGLEGLSAGEQEAFTALAVLTLMELKSSILLYDTPETHLNAAIERRLPHELEQHLRSNQIIMATHSLELIDAVPLEAIRVVLPYSNRNQVESLAGEESRIDIFRSLGVSRGIQLISRKVVFLEGASCGSDQGLLQRMFQDLPADVTFVPCGSCSDVLATNDKVLRLLDQGTKYSAAFALRDRDYLTNEQIEDLKGKYSNLMILPRYHLENYLLDATAISGVIGSLGEKKLTPEQVSDELSIIANSLREADLAAWASFQLNRRLRFVCARGPDPLTSLKESAAAASKELQVSYTADAIDRLVATRKEEVDRCWNKQIWEREFPGRQILDKFIGKHMKLKGRKGHNLVATELGRRRDSALFEELRSLLAPLWR